MANYFDQFDSDETPNGGNYFDQFDNGDITPPASSNQNTSLTGDLLTDLKRGVQKLPGMVTGLSDLPFALTINARPNDKIADALGELTGFQPSKWAEEAKQEYSPERQAAQAEIDKAWEDGSAGDIAGAYARNPGNIAGLIAESAPSMLTGGFIGRGALLAGQGIKALAVPATAAQAARQAAIAGGAGEGAVAAGTMMDQIDREVDPRTAALASTGAGVTTGLLGGAGARLTQRMGLADLESTIAGGAGELAGKAPGLGRRLAGGALTEGVLEELPQSVQEQAWQNWAEGRPLDEGLARAAVEGTLAGAGVGAAMNVKPRRTQEAPTEDAAPTGGVLSRAAAQLPAPEPVLGLPSPDQVAADHTGSEPLPGGPGMDQPTPRGREPQPAAQVPEEAAPIGIPDLRPEAFAVDERGQAVPTRVPSLPEPEPVEPETGMTRQAVPGQRPRFNQVLELARAGAADPAALAQETGSTPAQAARAIRIAQAESQVTGAVYKTVPGANRAKRGLSDPDAFEVVKTGNREWRIQRRQEAQDATGGQGAADVRGAGDQDAVPAAIDNVAGEPAVAARAAVEAGAPEVGGAGVSAAAASAEQRAALKAGGQKKTLRSRGPVPADASGAPGFAGQASQAGEAAPVVSPQSEGSVAQPGDKPKGQGEKVEADTSDSKGMPEILTQPRKAYLSAMAKKAGIKKGSPGYAPAMRKLQDEYDAQLDAASAALSFEQYHALNPESPEAVNRQAWSQLQEEYGRSEQPEAAETAGSETAEGAAKPDSERSPEEFIPAPDGSLDYGEITAEISAVLGRQAGKIRLRQGTDAWGLTHIRKRHLDQIERLGFSSVEEFVASVAKGFNAVYKRKGSAFDVVLARKGTGQRLIVQLEPSEDGDFYDVKSASPVRSDQFKNKQPLWDRAGTSSPVAESTPPSPRGQNGNNSIAVDESLGERSEPSPVATGQQPAFAAGNSENQPSGASPNARDQSTAKTIAQKPVSAQLAGVQPDAKIEDAGKKLGGARKDELRSVRDRLENMDDEAIAGSTLSELWPKGEVDKIDDPFHAAAYWALRSEIPAKPRVAYKLKRWVTKIKEARLTLGYLASLGADVSLAELRKASPALRSFANKVELLAAVERSQWPRVGRVEHRTGRYSENGEMVPGSWFEVEIDKRRQVFRGHDAMDSALPDIKKALAPDSAPTQEMKFAIYSSTYTGRAFIIKDGDKKKRHLKDFDDVNAAKAYLQDNHAQLVEAWEAVKNRDNVTKGDIRRSTNAPRVGQDYREGKDVTPDQFLEAFGFRGVEFGNWVGQGKGGRERQGMLNEAFDAFMDLAGIVGVSPKAMSLEGTLGIGFGSRGMGGRAAAHFEPDSVVINLTKTKGAGSLAHEWFHALDNYFSRKRGGPVPMKGRSKAAQNEYLRNNFVTYRPEPMYVHKSGRGTPITLAALNRYRESHPKAGYYSPENWNPDPSHPAGVRPKVERAFAELVETLDRSPMAARASSLDKTPNGYWSQIIERGARSFETYVIAKLADQGARNDFLANVTSLEEFARAPERYPYLTRDEQGPVSEAFDKLFATVETTEVDGKIAMFSRKGRGRTTGQALSRPELQGIVDDFLSRFKGADDVRVQIHDSAETLPSYRADRDSGSSIQGEYDFRTGTVHLVGASLGARDGKSAREVVEETLREEILVHKGLGVLSPIARRQLYAQIRKAARENKTIGRLWDETVAEYSAVAEDAKLTPEQADRYYAEELLGTLAQRKINWASRGWNRILRAIKRLAVRLGLAKQTDGPAELIKAVEFIADAFAKGRRARARNMGLDVRTEDGDLPAFRMASTAEGVAQARDAIDRALGRAKLDPADPFAAENRRLREEDRPIWDKAKKVFARQFAPGGLLPGDVFAEKVKRDSEFEAVEFDVRHIVGALEKAVQGDYGVAANQLTEDQMRGLSEALAGTVSDALPSKTKAGIVAMRQYIDRLSTEYIGILQQQVADRLKGSDQVLIDKITGNLGRYVHRSYQAYDDPNWFKKVPTATLNVARNYLAAGYRRSGESSAEAARLADVTVNEILKSGTAYDSLESFIAEGKLGAKDLSVLMKRKDVAPQIRALLGEHVDPRVNFAKSATKMGRLIWNQRFLDRVREVGMGTFLFEGKNRPADATTQIAGEQSETYSPLNGLWTFPEVAQAFKDALGKEQMGDLYRTVVRLNGMVKYGKTVLSPTTAMRNWQSAMFFSLANGHFNLQHMRKSMAAFREQVSQSATGDDLAYLRKLKQLGVVYDSPYAGEMMRLLEDARMDELLSGKSGKALSVFRKANQMAQGFYTFGDDFWKIIGFENEKASLRDAGFSETEAETMAAERIRNTYPTYSMVGRGMRWLSRFPLAGTFVSFPSEIVRTSANMLRTVAADLKSDNPKLRALGRKRAAGMALVSGGFYALSAMTAAALGVDDDEEEAIRDLGPPWQDNSTFMYLGRDPDGKLRYVDLSFLDPYGYWKRPVTAMLRNQPWEESAKSGVADMLTPFLGGDITAQAIFEVMANKKASGGQVYRENGEALDQLTDIANHMRKTIQPGFISNAERFVKAASGERREGSGQPYSVRDEVSALLGWRASTLDARTGLYYRSFDFNQALTDARSSLNRVLRSANAVDIDDIRTAKQGAERMNSKAFNEMARLVKAAESAGMSRREILQTLTLGGVSRRNAAALIRGQVPNLDIGGQARSRAVRQARVTQGPEQAREIARRYREVLAL